MTTCDLELYGGLCSVVVVVEEALVHALMLFAHFADVQLHVVAADDLSSVAYVALTVFHPRHRRPKSVDLFTIY